MKYRFIVFCLSSITLLCQPLFAATQENNPFQVAREAVRLGDRAKFERTVPQLQNAGLDAYIEYWRLLLNMSQNDSEQNRAFLARYENEYVAEKFRNDWLRVLGRKGQWADFDTEYANIVLPEQDIKCYAMQSRLIKRDFSALDEAIPLWQNLMEPPEACAAVLETLASAKRFSADEIWERVRRQYAANKTARARQTMAWLPQDQRPDPAAVSAVTDKSMQWLTKRVRTAEPSQAERELVALAISRIARNDPRMAVAQLEKDGSILNANQKSWVWGQIGHQAALRHIPDALSWYEKAGHGSVYGEALEWKARAALRAKKWHAVQATIKSMPPEMAADPTWVYWMGKTWQSSKKDKEAQESFMKIAGQPNFYGSLANEELGVPVSIPPKAEAPSQAEMAKIAALPGISRSLALFQADLRLEALREWNWLARSMSDRELLAAAQVALKANVYDRAIWSADRTKAEHDYSLRYLAPFYEQVRVASDKQSLDVAWVYGLMRQESRFVTNAKSSAGASGLMQLMPATAKWVAKKIGLEGFHHGKVHDTDINLLLGTSYLRLVYEDLDNHPVLASAAYNAGPGRARRWRADTTLDATIYAETIPFNETRDYVKKVVSNAAYYAALFENKPQTISHWLSPVGPKRPVDPKAEKLP